MSRALMRRRGTAVPCGLSPSLDDEALENWSFGLAWTLFSSAGDGMEDSPGLLIIDEMGPRPRTAVDEPRRSTSKTEAGEAVRGYPGLDGLPGLDG